MHACGISVCLCMSLGVFSARSHSPWPFAAVPALILQQEKQTTLLWPWKGFFSGWGALTRGGDIQWHLGCSKALLQELVAFSWLHSFLSPSEPHTQQLFPGVDGSFPSWLGPASSPQPSCLV